MEKYTRPVLDAVVRRARESRRFIQVLAGPRQVGKTMLAQQLMRQVRMPCHYCSADEPALQDRAWLAQQWDVARVKVGAGSADRSGLLIVDEVQKVTDKYVAEIDEVVSAKEKEIMEI